MNEITVFKLIARIYDADHGALYLQRKLYLYTVVCLYVIYSILSYFRKLIAWNYDTS